MRIKPLMTTVAATGALAGGGAALASAATTSAPAKSHPLHARRFHAPDIGATGNTGSAGMRGHCPGMGGPSSGSSFQPGPGGPPPAV